MLTSICKIAVFLLLTSFLSCNTKVNGTNGKGKNAAQTHDVVATDNSEKRKHADGLNDDTVVDPSTPKPASKSELLDIDLTAPILADTNANVHAGNEEFCDENHNNRQHKQKWSDNLSLRSIGEINEILDEEIVKRGPGFQELTLFSEDKKIDVKTGRDYAEAITTGFQSECTTFDLAMESWCLSLVVPLLYLKQSQSSCVSYVSNINLRKGWKSLLPQKIGHPVVQDMVCQNTDDKGCEKFKRVRKNPKRKLVKTTGLGKFKINAKKKNHINLKADGYYEMDFEIIAWGDFNLDGLEDILLSAAYFLEGGTYRDYVLFVMTRKSQSGLLEMIEMWNPLRSRILVPNTLNEILGKEYLTKKLVAEIRSKQLGQP